MNKSYESGQNSSYLPPIKLNQSVNIGKQRSNLELQLGKVNSSRQIANTKQSLTRRLVSTDELNPVEEYEAMNEKQLLREHEKLVKVLKKFQEIIDINLSRKQKEKEKNNHKGSSKEDIMARQITNNRKIIDNYLKEIRDLEAVKKQRKLQEVIDEKIAVNEQVAKLKKEIFHLKNEDMMAAKNLVNDRGIIERELKEHQKDLKIELTKNHDYLKKIDELTQQLNNLKKDCEGINMSELNTYRTSTQQSVAKLNQRKSELEELTRNYAHIEESIQQSMVAKARRNKNISKQIENCDKKIEQVNARIAQYKEKIDRYQKAMEIKKSDLN